MKNLCWTILAMTCASFLPLACGGDDDDSAPSGGEEAGASAGGDGQSSSAGAGGVAAAEGGRGGADGTPGGAGASSLSTTGGAGGDVNDAGGAGGDVNDAGGTGGDFHDGDAGGAGGSANDAGRGGAGGDLSDAGGEGGAGGAAAGQLEINGSYRSEFGDETITETSWASGTFVQGIVSYDNSANFAITTADGTFSKIVWTEPTNGSFSYCTVAYFELTASAAEQSPNTADANDLASGCGEFHFPWSTLTATSP